MRYKVGDKIKIRSDLKVNKEYGDLTMWSNTMYKELVGNTFTIKSVLKPNMYELEETCFTISDEMIERKVNESMKIKFKVGDIVKINKNATIDDLTRDSWSGCKSSTMQFLDEYVSKNKTFVVTEVFMGDVKLKDVGCEVGSIINTNILTLVERPRPILDEKEKEYLSAVIKPFRNKVKYIEKLNSVHRKKEFIRINLSGDAASLPDFEQNTMYEGMKHGKEYSLEELGL